jgi:hypothetical protein
MLVGINHLTKLEFQTMFKMNTASMDETSPGTKATKIDVLHT